MKGNFADCKAVGKKKSLQKRQRHFSALQRQSGMSEKKPQNHLRAWREYRRLTQEQLAEKVGTTGAVISLLESGARGLSLKWLNKLAPALNTKPGIILDYSPEDLDNEMMEIWADIPKENHAQAREILKTFMRKTG